MLARIVVRSPGSADLLLGHEVLLFSCHQITRMKAVECLGGMWKMDMEMSIRIKAADFCWLITTARIKSHNVHFWSLLAWTGGHQEPSAAFHHFASALLHTVTL